ncbi:hypothetical protein P8452_21373 [Trifolium repens]|nr:hypothetical protein P8452_21373 [Trifolium repens]
MLEARFANKQKNTSPAKEQEARVAISENQTRFISTRSQKLREYHASKRVPLSPLINENNVGTSSTLTQEFRENNASKRFAHSPLLNDSSKVDNQFVVSSPSTPSCNKTIHAKSNQTNLSNTSSPDMNFESPVSFVCNNTLGEASIGHNIGSYDFNLLLYNFDKTFDLYSIFY